MFYRQFCFDFLQLLGLKLHSGIKWVEVISNLWCSSLYDLFNKYLDYIRDMGSYLLKNILQM